MGSMSWWHWLIVLAVVVLLFGSRKLPDAARGLGRSMRIFKSEIKEMQNDDNPQQLEQSPQPGAAQPQAAQYAQPQQPYQQAPAQYAQPQQPYQQPPVQGGQPYQSAPQPYQQPAADPYSPPAAGGQQPGSAPQH